MADLKNTTDIKVHSFAGKMVKDPTESFSEENVWNHARNLVTNTHEGDLLTVSNEPSNVLAVTLPYTHIGSIHLYSDKWILFSTDNTNSEIGLFDESDNSYSKVVNDPCLGFKTTNLITGASKQNFDCTWSIYFRDSINPDRTLNIDRPPYKPTEKSGLANDNCTIEYTTDLNCEDLRLSRLVKTPSLKLSKGHSAGSLLNGSYQVVIAYTINQIRITDYFLPSNVQALFSHQNLSGSLQVTIEEMDTDFEEFELVILATTNNQTQAKRVGFYSTRQRNISIDRIDQTQVTVPLEYIPLQSPYYDKSDGIFEVNNYLIRTGVRTKADFNYQLQANKIKPMWVALELPSDYYAKGGNITSYMGDEQYVFFIRWIYNSAQKSASYVISGRAPLGDDTVSVSGADVLEAEGVVAKKWESENTAKITNKEPYTTSEGTIIAEGEMAYYESTEKYPDNKPEIWGDLCGKNIRLCKFPDRTLIPHIKDNGAKIVVLGVKFGNITHPLDSSGNPIQDIVGYEILRGSREGNRSIIAKGLLNNTGQYDIPKGISDKTGLYPNYPFNDLRTDPFLSKDIVKGGCNGKGYQPMGSFRKDVFTFHSPETQFRNPFLNVSELKIEGHLSGLVTGSYAPVYKHPRHKLIRDFALLVSGIVGVAEGLIAILGKKTTTTSGPRAFNAGITEVGVSEATSLANPGVAAYYTGTSLLDGVLNAVGLDQINQALGDIKSKGKVATSNALASAVPGLGMIGGASDEAREGGKLQELPLALKIIGGAFMFTYYFAQGTEQALRIIKTLIPFQQYAYQYNSHGLYDKIVEAPDGNKRRLITEANYLEPALQEFSDKFRVNNLFRSRQVILQVDKDLEFPSIVDNTRQSIGDRSLWDSPTDLFTTTTSAYYGSLKVALKAQYGQLDSVIQIPVSTGIHPTSPIADQKYISPALFGGDVYITPYTEKNSMFYFNDWLFDVPDGFEIDYNNHYNIPYPRYWLNSNEYDVSQLTSALTTLNFKEDVLPNDLAHLDRKSSDCNKKVSFVISKAYFYLFNSGIREFFVESEINTAFRDHGDLDSQKHYDSKTFTDLKTLFRSDIITAGNHFAYDYSLSISKLLQNYISWSSILPRDYNPASEKCFSYYPDRAIYSLQHQEELKKDNWLAYLANNKKDFKNKITAVKSVNKTGALILFENESPVEFQGIDQLQSEGGVKFTIGDGGLFQQPLQNTSNADRSFEYGSCQSASSVISTPMGVFWISQDQGKIFTFNGGPSEISAIDLNFWFAEYLPSKLLMDFPDFELRDNPVAGIGVQTTYDSINKIIYFSKKDYELKEMFRGVSRYVGGDNFVINGNSCKLGDLEYFNPASFTISMNVARRSWISFHDWFPGMNLLSKRHFLTSKDNKIYRHNSTCDSFCNFYGIDYPFEIEYPVSSGQTVSMLSSLEYILEAYRYYNKCRDAHHILDENFDRMIVSNSEQISGLIKLQMVDKNSPQSRINTATSSFDSVTLKCIKEENKYRINGITDLTRDRGEFSGNTRPMWVTEPNGYIKQINPNNVNYSKSLLQRKKMRHYYSKIFFRKNISGSTKLILKVSNTKIIQSFR